MNPLLSLAAFLPIVGTAVWRAAGELRAPVWLVGLAGGLFAWTLIEYLLHRFAHDVQIRAPGGTAHSGHHARPTDLRVMVTPLWFTLPTTLAIWGLLRLLAGDWARSGVVLIGIVAGYCCYEVVHYTVHISGCTPRWLRFWREYHFRHHFENTHRGYGVTSPLWDWAFGTVPESNRHAYNRFPAPRR